MIASKNLRWLHPDISTVVELNGPLNVESDQIFEALCASLPVGIFRGDLTGRLLFCNTVCAEILGIEPINSASIPAEDAAELCAADGWLRFIHDADRDRVEFRWKSFLASGGPFTAGFRVHKPDGASVWAQVDATVRRDDDQRAVDIVGTVVVTLGRTETEHFLALENELLEAVSQGLPLEEALLRLTRFIERQSVDMITSVLLMGADGTRLWHGAAPSLDPGYSERIDGVLVGEGVGSCGTAAFRGEPVFVEDIETDPLWAGFRELPRRYGLRACWSTPLKDLSGSVLGTIAVYRTVPGAPTAHHVRIIDMAAHLASIVLARHRDEQNLLQSEQRFRRMFEHAAIGVAQVDSTTGTILRANRRYCDILGIASQELRGKNWLSLTHPDDTNATATQMERLLAGEIREFALEERLQRSDGEFIWVNLTVSAMWQAGAKPTTHSAIVEDISKRKQAEEALRQSEERFRNLVQTAPFGVLRNDLDGRITFANAALGRIYECSTSELVGTAIWDLALDESSRKSMYSQLQRGSSHLPELEIGQVASGFLARHITRTGRAIDVHIDWTHERNRDGGDFGLIVIVTDVTTRREFERRLEFQADVLKRVSDAVLVTDDRGSVTYANEAAERMFEIRSEHRSGDSLLPLHEQLLVSGLNHREVMLSLKSLGQWQGEKEVQIDGESCTVEAKLKAFHSPNSGRPFLLSLVRDVSMRKQAELERRHHRDTLAHMTRLATMGELVAGIAHEVKQPLYAIANFATAASISLRNMEPGVTLSKDRLGDLNEFCGGVRRASQRANEIIQRLREFARKSEQSRARIDLNEVIHDSIDLVAFEARQCDAVVEADLQEGLPSVVADRIQCEQVVVNLLHNAYESVANVDRPRRVVVRTHRRGDQIEIDVEDNGTGIEPSQEARIFEAFCTTKPTGMGMGLAISRTIVEDHGGRLSVTPSSPRGATFKVALPIANAQRDMAN